MAQTSLRFAMVVCTMFATTAWAGAGGPVGGMGHGGGFHARGSSIPAGLPPFYHPRNGAYGSYPYSNGVFGGFYGGYGLGYGGYGLGLGYGTFATPGIYGDYYNNVGYGMSPIAPAYEYPNLMPLASELSQRNKDNATRSVAPPVQADTAEFTIRVPADAEVWIEGVHMTQQGAERHFVSPKLTPGMAYNYEVRASWYDNGKAVNETQRFTVHAGDQTSILFIGSKPKLDSLKAQSLAKNSNGK